MLINRFLATLALSAVFLPMFAATSQGTRPTLAVVGGRIIDGYGAAPIDDGIILIAGERISAVGRRRELPVPPGTPVVDANGMTVMPGLIDMHVHNHAPGPWGLQAVGRSVWDS